MFKKRFYIKSCLNISITCKIGLLILLFFACPENSSAQVKNEDELKKEALKTFEDENYAQSYKLYAQLVSLYPKDPDYNYHLGVCMLYTEPDKKKPFSYLQIAVNNPKDAPKDAKFYLAKAYHYNYRFDDAIKLYTEYKQTASPASIKKLQVDREIDDCKNGKRLLSNLSDLVIIDKKQLNEADYFRSYNLSDIGGKLLVKPDDFKTGADKKKKDRSVIYLPRNGERIYYSSYGDNGDRGRDIYFVNKLPNGAWSKPQALPASINTEYDEDYPFLHPNGHTLYFSSKGHNSMGGYDIFKTTFDDQTNTWSKPVNLDFPINSPDDDILFVTDSLEKTAYFSSGRYSPFGKIDVMKINTERRPMDIAVLKGTVVKEEASQSVRSKITVKNIANGEIVGTYQAQENGDYYMELPNGGKFIFTVETPGIPTQSDGVQMPVAYSLKPYKQVISYDKKVLKIINYFDGEIADDNYAMYLDLIEKKAKLEINENEPYNNSLINKNPNGNGSDNLPAVTTNNPTVVDDQGNLNTAGGTNKTGTNKNISNEQLLDLAREDLKETTEEAKQLKQQAQDAMGLATEKNQEASETQKQADEALAKANALTDVNQKNEELGKANDLKEQAKIASGVANTASNLAKKLEVDANLQQQEADLSTQYIRELETVIKNKNNKEALAKLDQLQKQLDELSKQKNQSDELFESLKAEADLKRQALKAEEQKNEAISHDISALGDEVKDLQKDMANEKDNALKENISAQIREVNADIDSKNKEIAANNQKISQLNNESEGIKKELEIAAKILNEKTDNIAGNTPADGSFDGAVITKTTSVNPGNTTAITYSDLSAKYNAQAKPIDANASTGEREKQNDILNTYNKEITDLIAIDKTEVGKAKTPADKKKLNDEIKKLEKQAADNKQLIAANNAKIREAGNVAAIVNNAVKDPGNTTAINNNTATVTDPGNTTAIATNTGTAGNDNVSAISSNTTNPGNNPNNENALGTDGSASNTPLNQIPTGSNTDNSQYLADLDKIKNGLSQNSAEAKDLFAFNNYKEATSLTMKNDATAKYDLARQNEAALAKLVNDAETAIKNNSGADPASMVGDAEALNSQALELRKQSATKAGAEKNALLKQAADLEKQAVSKKLQASDLASAKNAATLGNNQANIDALLKLNGDKAGDEISQARMLADEAQINFRQAKKIREESRAYPTDASKLGGYGNAEEKESEALAKQEKSISLLQKNNPSYTLKNNAGANDPSAVIAGVNQEISKTSQSLATAYTALSRANQNELKLQGDKLLKNPVFKTSQASQDLKNASDNANREATALIAKANTVSNPGERSALLLQANQKELEAIRALSDAAAVLASSPIANNTTGNNTPANANVGNNDGNPDNTTGNNTAIGSNSTTAVNNNGNPAANKTGNNTDGGSVSNKTPDNSAGNTNPANTNTVAAVSTNSNNPGNTNGNNGANNGNAIGSSTVTNNEAGTTIGSNTVTANENGNTIANTSGINGVGDDAVKLKGSLNNAAENNLTSFNSYSNSDALALKAKALEKIDAALTEDKNLGTQLDNVVELAGNRAGGSATPEQLSSEADQFTSQASGFRKQASAATGPEKDQLVAQAKALEAQAVGKKIEASDMQKGINAGTFDANAQSLQELMQLTKGKNIAEKDDIEALINEATIDRKKGLELRQEANASPSDAARLGGFNNAEEKEADAIAKQQKALALYKKYAPGYVPKQPALAPGNPEASAKFNTVKNAVDANTARHTEGLTLLAQANEKEYKSRFVALPANLNPAQQSLKAKAQAAYKQSQNLLAQANQSTDALRKKDLLVQSNQKGQEAISDLNGIISSDVSLNGNNPNNTTDPGNNTGDPANTAVNNPANTNNGDNNTNPGNRNPGNANPNNTNPDYNNTAGNTNPNNANTNPGSNNPANTANTATGPVVKIKADGVEVKRTNAYSAAKPIPIDEKIQDGLVFKVQVGAFKNPLPNEQFRGLTPVIGQTTPNGYIRYMAGNFEKYDGANAVKNDLRRLGYNDAFVVAYYNGQRITLNEAVAKLQASTGQPVDLSANTSAGLSENTNIPRNNFPVNANPSANAGNTDASAPAEVTKELEQINGLLYTVQIGVFSKQVTRSQLYNLRPIYTEKLPNGLYRYTAGIYIQNSRLVDDKRKVVELGVRDAFVSAYYNSKRIPFAEAQKLQAENNSLKLEAENPIVFPNGAPVNANTAPANNAPAVSNPPANNTVATPTAAPFTNNVKAPEPTAENGVKSGEEGIAFKVQIGAYKNQVPNEVAAKFLNIKTWPVENKVTNGLYIYTIGNFTGLSFAKKLKDEAISVGITDAFITVYKDGKKLYGQEAAQYLGQ